MYKLLNNRASVKGLATSFNSEAYKNILTCTTMNMNYVLERKSVERKKASDTKLTRLKHKFHMYKLMVYRGSSVSIVNCEAILAMTRNEVLCLPIFWISSFFLSALYYINGPLHLHSSIMSSMNSTKRSA